MIERVQRGQIFSLWARRTGTSLRAPTRWTIAESGTACALATRRIFGTWPAAHNRSTPINNWKATRASPKKMKNRKSPVGMKDADGINLTP
eukprot:2710831-Prymnesium_polylepis.3